MSTRTERAKTFFGNPDLYLRGNHRVSLRAHFVRGLLGDLRNSRILDLGCGDGRISAQFLPAGNHVTMLDLSDRMLERVKNNVPPECAARVDYVKSDILAFNPGALYDVVLCIGVLAHVNSIEETIAKVASFVKPGGRCVFQLSDSNAPFSSVGRCFYAARHFLSRSSLDYKAMTLPEVVSVAARYGLTPLSSRRHLLLLFPGMTRLLGRWLIPYDLFTSNNRFLSKQSSDVLLVCGRDDAHDVAPLRRERASRWQPIVEMDRLKIAHVTTVGISLYGLLLNQMRSLRQEGYEIVAISSPSSFAPAIEAAGIRHIAVSITRKITPVADLVSLWRLWRVMRRERFTIVHTHTPKAGLLGQLAARLAGVPLVVNTVHGFYLHSGMNPTARRIYLLLEKLAAICSNCILSQNAEDIEIAVREHVCRAEKIKFLGNGIDLTQFDPDAVSTGNVARLRAELGLKHCARVVGFVGRLAAKRKGFADFLAAAREIAARVPDCQFLVVGESDHGKADATEASAAGVHGVAERFVFAGQRDKNELPHFYKLMDVLVLPSIFEGLPRVVMEASAMGVPSVVTEVKGNREAVVHECNGLLVPLGDIRALADAVIRVLTDRGLANEMSAKGRGMALERFDEQATFATVKAEYRRLLSEKRPFSAPICSQAT
ncbi:MAG TPA: glycosyltransferase [Burkholderiales bacterium]